MRKRFSDLFPTNEDMGVSTPTDLAIEEPVEGAEVDLVENADATEPDTGVTVVEIDHSNGQVSVNGNNVSEGAVTQGTGAGEETIVEAVGGEEADSLAGETGAPLESPEGELAEQSAEAEPEAMEVSDAEEDPATEGEELEAPDATEPAEDDKVASEVILGGNEPAEELPDEGDVADVSEEGDVDLDVDTEADDANAPEPPTEVSGEAAPEQQETDAEEQVDASVEDTVDSPDTETSVESEETDDDSDDVLDAEIEDEGETETEIDEVGESDEAEDITVGDAADTPSEDAATATEKLASEETSDPDTPSTEEVSAEEVPPVGDEPVADVTEGSEPPPDAQASPLEEAAAEEPGGLEADVGAEAPVDGEEVPNAQEPTVSSDDLTTATAGTPEQTPNTVSEAPSDTVPASDHEDAMAAADSQTAMIEGDQALSEQANNIEGDGEAATLALNATDKLQELVNAAERAKETGSFSPEFAQVVEITHESILAPLDLTHRGFRADAMRNPTVSLENYRHPAFMKDAVDLTVENLKESVKAIITKVIQSLYAIGSRVIKYVQELMGQKQGLQNHLTTLRKGLEKKVKDGLAESESTLQRGMGVRIGKEASAKTAKEIAISAERLMTASYSFMADVAHSGSTGKSVSDLMNIRDKYIGRIGGGEEPGTYGNLGKGQAIEFAEDDSGRLYIVDNGTDQGVEVKAAGGKELLSVLDAAQKVLDSISEFQEMRKYAEETVKASIDRLKKGLSDEEADVAEDLTAPARALLSYITFFTVSVPRVASSSVREILTYVSAASDNLRKTN